MGADTIGMIYCEKFPLPSLLNWYNLPSYALLILAPTIKSKSPSPSKSPLVMAKPVLIYHWDGCKGRLRG